MSLQPHEIEQAQREQDELNAQIAFDSFKPDAVAQIVECFDTDGDLEDLLADIYLQADAIDIDLEHKDLTRFAYEAAIGLASKKAAYSVIEHEGQKRMAVDEKDVA